MGRKLFQVRHKLALVLSLVLVLNLGCGAQDISDDNTLDDVPKPVEVVESDIVFPDDNASPEVTENQNDESDVKEVETMDVPGEPPVADENPISRQSGKYLSLDEPDLILPRANLEEDLGEFAHIDGRTAPSTTYNVNGQPYVITEIRLRQLRARKLYPFYDLGGDENLGDYQRDIHSGTTQVHKNFNFQLPFFGFRFNYTRISVNGYIEFSDPPSHYTYPLTFPIKDWPNQNDPSFIGIFFSKCRIGSIRPEDIDQRRPGIYFRMERDLQGRTDQPGVETRERITWDIRTGVIGSEAFYPKHAVIVTWKNISFAGGIDNSLYKTNSFQMVLATDEVFTYAIFNYVDLQWTSHTEAGGDTTGGEGGVPAYIGFNAGNGTQSYEYSPYSQASILRDLVERGYANDIKGRHIFRIDEKILTGTCNKDIDGANLPLVFAPESGNMLGGTIVNITGPCFFKKSDRINCRFHDEDVVGVVVDTNRAICVQPAILAEGYVRFEIAINAENYKWKGRYFVETPATASEKIFFVTTDVHERYPAEIKITWDAYNLTTNLNAGVRVALWGYKETKIRPELQFIDILEEGVQNRGEYTIAPGNYRNRDNFMTNDLQFGFIQINLTNPQDNSGLGISPVLWSRPIPLGWYFAPQWEKIHGNKWPERMCNNWLTADRYYKNFASDVPLCPCTLEHALLDKGRFMPDFSCDKDANPKCFYNRGAVHCVRSGNPSLEGSGQQCCYDKNDYLMLSYDQQWGSRPQRSHNLGFLPWTEASKVPTLSHWFHDQVPYYQCCLWQEEQAVGCETYRFERRPSQDCVAYQPPGVGAIFGDPHFVTFDGLQYTFNGKGEFVLVRTDVPALKLDVQGRFEQVSRNVYGAVKATQLTSVVAAGNNSAIIEVRLRPEHAQWRYRLDVFANGKRIYFDRPSLKVQHFPGVLVYTPTYILNQSEVIMMFQSGAGVEVVENKGFMSARIYLPWSYINQTRGLLGNWSWDMVDDFARPDGTIAGINLANFENAHMEFARHWMLTDRAETGKGAAMFTREFSRTSSYYTNATFAPNFIRDPADFLPPNRSIDINRASELCGDCYQCKYDYGMSLHRDMAHFTKNYYNSIINIRETNSKRVFSCGVLETPRFGRKSNFFFIPGTKVTFECNQNFVLTGDQRRTCMPEGRWDVPIHGYTECLRTQEYSSRQYGLTGGIIAAIILPILLLLGCCWFCCVKKGQYKENSKWDFQKFEPRSLSSSRANLRSRSMENLADDKDDTLKKNILYERQQSEPNLHKRAFYSPSESPDKEYSEKEDPYKYPQKEQSYNTMSSPPPAQVEPKDEVEPNFDSDKSDVSDVPTLPKKRRSYEKTYKTHEPLVGHPNADFPPKLWALAEEDADSSLSNDGSDKTNTELSQPAKDIEYINKPRQYGRRAERAPDSGYSTTGSRVSPPYNEGTFKFDDLSPVSYSPSTSGTVTPSVSPNSELSSPKYSFPINSFITPIAIPEEPSKSPPYNKMATFGLPVSKGQSYDTLLQPSADPIQQGTLDPEKEIDTYSSRTTMV